MGKLRANLKLNKKLNKAEIIKLAQDQSNVQVQLKNKMIMKVVYRSNKIVNFVIN